MTIDETDLREFVRDIEDLAERIKAAAERHDNAGAGYHAEQIVRAIQNRRMRGELPR